MLRCTFKGHPIPTIGWRIPPGILTVASGYKLTIPKMESKDVGIYQCYVFNDLGYSQNEIIISYSTCYVNSSVDSGATTTSTITDISNNFTVLSTSATTISTYPSTTPSPPPTGLLIVKVSFGHLVMFKSSYHGCCTNNHGDRY